VALAGSPALSQTAQEAVMADKVIVPVRVSVTGHGELEVEGLTPASLAALRLVQYHAPNLTVNCHNGVGFLRVRLADIDLRPSFAPSEPVNMDRAQLAKLGG